MNRCLVSATFLTVTVLATTAPLARADGEPAAVAAAPDSEPSAETIVARADDIMDPGDFDADIEMRVKRKGEDDRVYRMQMQGSGSTKMLITFDYPPREKGQAFLRSGDDMWMYLPGINKTLRIPQRGTFAGGDFSDHDMLSVRLQRDYVAVRLDDETMNGVACYSLKLQAKNTSATYASIRYWVSKKTFWPVRKEFYTVSGTVFKSLDYTSQFGGPRPDTETMSNVLERDKLTVMVRRNLHPAPHSPTMFSESYLIRRR